MWTVERPSFDATQTFSICISRVKDSGLKERLESIAPVIASTALEYEAKAKMRSLHLLETSESVGGRVTKSEMAQVYDQRMADKGTPGRAIYDQIKLLPKGDRCPFCDQRNVSTLDHILPKALYPSLAVTPINLVGACMECNKMKLSFAPKLASEVMLHPYFDDITNEPWLAARVVQSHRCVIVFTVVRASTWDDVTEARARAQFEMLGLGSLYSIEAARELANIRHNLQKHLDAGGSEAVQRELQNQWESRRANRVNSWQTAMYRAMADDPWFCGGGFST